MQVHHSRWRGPCWLRINRSSMQRGLRALQDLFIGRRKTNCCSKRKTLQPDSNCGFEFFASPASVCLYMNRNPNLRKPRYCKVRVLTKYTDTYYGTKVPLEAELRAARLASTNRCQGPGALHYCAQTGSNSVFQLTSGLCLNENDCSLLLNHPNRCRQ